MTTWTCPCGYQNNGAICTKCGWTPPADPAKNLADAALELLTIGVCRSDDEDCATVSDCTLNALEDALAAYDAAQVSEPPSAVLGWAEWADPELGRWGPCTDCGVRTAGHANLASDPKVMVQLCLRCFERRPGPKANAAQVPPSDAEIDEWRDYVIRVAGLDLSNGYHRHIFDWGRRLMRRARPEPAPSDAEIDRAISAMRTADLRNDWATSREAQDRIRALVRARPDAGLLPPGSILPSAPLVPPHDGLLRVAKSIPTSATSVP